MKEQWTDDQLGIIKIVRNPRARRVIMRIKPECIQITCPPYAPLKEVHNIIEQNRDKIANNKKTVDSRASFIDENFTITTDLLQLNITLRPQDYTGTLADKFTVNRKKGTCTITCPYNTDFTPIQTWLKGIIVEELRLQAKAYLPNLTAQIANTYGFKFSGVKIQSSRTNWGSCSGKNSINLSLYLMTLPSHLIDYVIKHELCHTVHHDHSPNFWALMDSVTDNKAHELRKELKTHHTAL